MDDLKGGMSLCVCRICVCDNDRECLDVNHRTENYINITSWEKEILEEKYRTAVMEKFSGEIVELSNYFF